MSECRNCGKEVPKKKGCFGYYCDNKCQGAHKNRNKIEAWLAGTEKGWVGKTRQICSWLRVYLKLSRGSACSICGWDGKHPLDGNSLTEIDHIDGNAENCTSENLRILCPNCHSMTDTFRARNKNSKRER